jgi:hypothetical protein
VEMPLGIGPVMAFSRFSDVTVSQEGRDTLEHDEPANERSDSKRPFKGTIIFNKES